MNIGLGVQSLITNTPEAQIISRYNVNFLHNKKLSYDG